LKKIYKNHNTSIKNIQCTYIYSNYLHGFQLGFALHETTSHRRSLYFVTSAIKSKLYYTIHKFTFAIYSSMLLR